MNQIANWIEPPAEVCTHTHDAFEDIELEDLLPDPSSEDMARGREALVRHINDL